jgi:hypothetical protein
VGATGQALEEHGGLPLVGRLSEDLAVQDHLGVTAQDQVAVDGACLAARVLDDDVTRLALGQLLDVGRARRERDAQLLEDCPPLRRGGRED